MALTTSAGPNWISQYGAARNKAKSALQKGTVEADIDWDELQLLAERAGVADLYSQEALVQENYVPTTDPEYAYSGQQSAIGKSAGTAATFDDEEEAADEEAAVPAAYTQEELDSVDINSVLDSYGMYGPNYQEEFFKFADFATPLEHEAFRNFQASGGYKAELKSRRDAAADEVEDQFDEEDSGDDVDRGEEGLREDRYNEFVRMLQEDPYRTDINMNAIYNEDRALGDMVNSYLGSTDYLNAQRDADGAEDETDDPEVDPVVDPIVEDEVVEWDYNAELRTFVADNYAKFKTRIAAGDDITTSVMDLLLSAGASPEVASAKAADATMFITGRVQTELDAEADAETDEGEQPIVEEDPAVVVEEPIVDEEPVVVEEEPVVDEEPVVVVDVAGNEIVPENDAQVDMDESVNEILRLIDGVDFSDATQVEDVRATIEGVFEDYGVALDGILSIEGASNVIDKYIDDILVQSLEQSTELFEDTDPEETFGRKAEAGIEISMERIIDSLAIDEKEILEKTSTLINQKYDDAFERLGRLGLIEGGGIAASGTNIRQAEELESARATELIQAELEVGEKYRAELRETLLLFENIKTSRATEAIEEQKIRISTTQQLLDFVVSLEEIRLGGRAADVSESRLLLEERSLDIEDFRARADERLREAELTGLLDEEETLAMREVMSRIELDKKRLDLEAKIADRELSIQEKAQALNDLVQIRTLNLEAKKFNLEESLGMSGMDIEERRIALDEVMANAGMSIEERKLALDTLLGEGELAIRADLAVAEIEQITINNYLMQKEDRRADIELRLQEGEINNRMALDMRRLDLETFITANDIELRTRGLDIQETELEQRAGETAEEFAIRREELKQRAGETTEEFALRRDELKQRVAETDEEYKFRREQLGLEEKLGFARLEQEGQKIGLEERRVLLDEMVEVGRLDLATQQLAFEELMSNQEYDLAERRYYTDQLLANRGLDQRDKEILTNEMLANSKISLDEARLEYEKLSDEKRLALEERGLVLREDMTEAEIQVLNRNMQLSEDRLELEKTSMANTEAARAFEQSMALADRTGFYVGLDGTMIPTMASRTADREFELREKGLDIEAERLRISSNQFDEGLKQQIAEFAATHDLNLRETEALIAKTEADIAAQSARLAQDIAQADEGNKINWESLRLRGVEIEVGKEATEEEMAFRREQLQLQIEQQNLDRANDASQFAESLDLSLAEFESAQDRWETEWQFSSEMAAKEFGLEEEEFLILKWQIEQDIELKGKSLEEASAQWAAEFGLDEEQVRQAMEFSEATFNERVRTIGLENDLTEAQSDALAAELAKFNKEEQRRDTMWEDVLGDKIDWDNEDDVKKFAAHMALINGTGLGGGGQGGKGGLFAPEPGIVESITEFGMDWLIKEYGDETANAVRGLLGDGFNAIFGGGGDDGTAEWLMDNGVEGVDWLLTDDGLVEDLRAPGAGVSTESAGAVAAVATKLGPAVMTALPYLPMAAAAAGVVYFGNRLWNEFQESDRLSKMSIRERADEWDARDPEAAAEADNNIKYFDLWFDTLPFKDQEVIYNNLMTDAVVEGEYGGEVDMAWDTRGLGGQWLDGQYGDKIPNKIGTKHNRNWATSLSGFESSTDPNALVNEARDLNAPQEDGSPAVLNKDPNNLTRTEVARLSEFWDSMTGEFRNAFLREATGLNYSRYDQSRLRDISPEEMQQAAATYVYGMDIMSQDTWSETLDTVSDTVSNVYNNQREVGDLTIGEVSTINRLYDQISIEDQEILTKYLDPDYKGKDYGSRYRVAFQLDPESDKSVKYKSDILWNVSRARADKGTRRQRQEEKDQGQADADQKQADAEQRAKDRG
jgi:hypothetical protein